MPQTILITGAIGMIGRALTEALLNRGYRINQLTRKSTESSKPGLKKFTWDVAAGYLDENCIADVSAIIHLAGENVAARPWTRKRKLELIESRTKSICMIYDLLKKHPAHQVKSIISASASGIYGDRGDILLTEECVPGEGFLAGVSVQWEKAVDAGSAFDLRIVKLRCGVVLDKNEGALPQLIRPVKLGLAATLGAGKQWMPWIHISDAVNMYIFALENKLAGVYNMVAPEMVTNEQFMHILARAYRKSWWLPRVPAVALRIILGKMSEMLLMSTRISSQKIQDAGFKFRFPELSKALDDLL